MKLGKLAPQEHPKTLKLEKYLLGGTSLVSPAKVYWEYKIAPSTIGMFANDRLGDCTIAAVAHYVMLATAHTGTLFTPTDDDVINMYSEVSGYVRGDDSTDNGAVCTDVLNYWQTEGLSGHKILAWASINYKDPSMRHLGIYLFGANYVGVQLPASAQDQFANSQSWDVVPHDPIEGGHCILETGYGSLGSNFQTWGKGDQKASSAWSARYMDEAYVVITEDWLNQASGLAPNLLDLDTLQQDLKKVAS